MCKLMTNYQANTREECNEAVFPELIHGFSPFQDRPQKKKKNAHSELMNSNDDETEFKGFGLKPIIPTMQKSLIALSSVLLLSGALAQAAPQGGIKPIDPELVAKKFKRGQFLAESTMQDADGQTQTSAETMCMDEASANMLPMMAMMGLANCEPTNTAETKTSMSVAGICRNAGTSGDGKAADAANFYTGAVRWSADGKTIDLEMKRTELVNDKPSDKVLLWIKQSLKFQSRSCK